MEDGEWLGEKVEKIVAKLWQVEVLIVLLPLSRAIFATHIGTSIMAQL